MKINLTIVLLIIILLINFYRSKGQNVVYEYYSNGRTQTEKDTVTGNYREYYDNGQLLEEGKLVNEKPIGIWKSYTKNGLLWQETKSDSNRHLGKKTYIYSSNRTLVYEKNEYTDGEYINGKFTKGTLKHVLLYTTFHINNKPNLQIKIVNNDTISKMKWNINGEKLDFEKNTIPLSLKSRSEIHFIELLSNNRIDSCLMYLHMNIGYKYNVDTLSKELTYISKLFKEFPNPLNSLQIGQSYNGVGTFGHDNDGEHEKESTYTFTNSIKKTIYQFSIYYSDKEPIEIIKFFKSENLKNKQ